MVTGPISPWRPIPPLSSIQMDGELASLLQLLPAGAAGSTLAFRIAFVLRVAAMYGFRTYSVVRLSLVESILESLGPVVARFVVVDCVSFQFLSCIALRCRLYCVVTTALLCCCVLPSSSRRFRRNGVCSRCSHRKV